MSTHNICFHGEIRKISVLFVGKSSLSRIMFSEEAWFAGKHPGHENKGKSIGFISPLNKNGVFSLGKLAL